MTMGTGGPVLRTLDLIIHKTDHDVTEEGRHIQTTFRGLVEDTQRTAAICDDIAQAMHAGRNCLVLTRWTEHLTSITEMLAERGVEALVLHGQMGKKARAAVIEKLAAPLDGEVGLVLAATSSLLGEGFDCPPLDTLFLAFPIKFKGSVVQCVGRVLRPIETKNRIEVHDYIDVRVPVLARMHDERRRAYASLGFDLPKSRRSNRTGKAMGNVAFAEE
jgi:superfamily II DNA or RNA helicase